MKIGFIGTGVMGTGIINNLLKHGNEVTVFNRTQAHAQADVQKIMPILQQISASQHYFGPAGSGQHAKMANQIMVAGTMTGMTEMLVYAKKAGLNLADVIQTVGAGAAANWSLSNYGPRILKQDYTPGFFAKHFLKDLRIALDEAEQMGLELPATAEAKRLYGVLVDQKKLGNDGTQALVKLWWNQSN